MKRQLLIILAFVFFLVFCGCSKMDKPEGQKLDELSSNTQDETGISNEAFGSITFDLKEFDDLDLAKEALKEQVMELFTSHPIIRLDYYPLEGNDKITVTIQEGKIDFSTYILDGDINRDGFVDEKDLDLILDAFIEGRTEKEFDLDGDGKLTTDDIEYLSRRLLTEVASFGFYNEEGNQLDIPVLTFGSNQIISVNDYSDIGLKDGSVVIVVPQDINGASPFNMSAPPTSSEGVVDGLMDQIINEVIEGFDRDPEKYLVTWSVSIKAIARTGQSSSDGTIVEVAGVITPYLDRLKQAYEASIAEKHFGYHPLDLPLGVKRVRYNTDSAHHFIAMSGRVIHNIKATNYHADVVGVRSSRTVTHATQSGGRTIRVMLEINDMALYNVPSTPRKVNLKVNGWTNPNGVIELTRIGPGAGHTDEVSESMQKGESEDFLDLYTGDYEAVLRNDCENFRLLITDAQSFFYEDHFVFDLEVLNRVEVTGRVIESGTGDPLEGKKVELVIKCQSFGIDKIEPVYTDGSGRFILKDVPYGIYELRLEDAKHMDVRLEDASETSRNLGDLQDEVAFDIELEFVDTYYGPSFYAKWTGVKFNFDSERYEREFKIILDGYEALSDDQKSIMDTAGWATELLPDRFTWRSKAGNGFRLEQEAAEPVGIVVYYLENGTHVKAPVFSGGSEFFEGGTFYVSLGSMYSIVDIESDDEVARGFETDRYYLSRMIKIHYPGASLDDGWGNLYDAKVNTQGILRLFEGNAFVRSGHSLSIIAGETVSVGEYKLTIKPHGK